MIKRLFGGNHIQVDLDTVVLYSEFPNKNVEIVEFNKKDFEEMIDWYNNGKEYWKVKTLEYKKRKGME